MRAKSLHAAAVLALAAFPLGASSTERLVKMQEIEEPPRATSPYRLTRQNDALVKRFEEAETE